MAENRQTLTIRLETVLWAVILLGAAALRLPALGIPSLNNAEALSAFTSLGEPTGAINDVASPLVTIVNRLIFTITTGSTASARLFPAFAGILLVMTPLLLREKLGRLSALLAGFWIALSPTFSAASRQVTGEGIALLAFICVLCSLDRGFSEAGPERALLTGFLLAAGMLADELFLLLVLMAGVGFYFARLTSEPNDKDYRTVEPAPIPWAWIAAGFAGSLIIISTSFFRDPAGLGALGAVIARFITGIWSHTPGTFRGFVPLFSYEMLTLIIGGFALAKLGMSSRFIDRLLAGWAFAGLLFMFLYQGAEPLDSIALLFPLILLGSRFVIELFIHEQSFDWRGWPALSLGVIAIIAMITTNLTIFQSGTATGIYAGIPFFENIPIDLTLAFLWLALLGVIAATVGLNRGGMTVAQAFAAAGLVLALAFGSGRSVKLAYTDPLNPVNPLRSNPAQAGVDLFTDEIESISRLAEGSLEDAEIVVEGDPFTALGWALRKYPHLTFVEAIPASAVSDIIITPVYRTELQLSADYVGQDFVMTGSWLPNQFSIREYIRWLVMDQSYQPVINDKIILWVRDDIYTLSENTIP